MITEVQKKQLGTILEMMAEDLDISQSQYEDAQNKYNAVGHWLAKPESELARFDPRVFPQGSIRLGTVVKPLGRDEFDVDLVCEMGISSNANHKAVYDVVGRQLRQDKTYQGMLEPKNRCWRLNYAGQFHMDILPAIPDTSKLNGCLLVPDRDLEVWKPSNPEGYAKWFQSRMEVVRKTLLEYREVEELPKNHAVKTPLQRAVQILKRHRDIIFENNKDDAPLSIVITTLAAKAYGNEPELFDSLMDIITGMPKHLDQVGQYPAVLNPTNPDENFAEKWIEHPERYNKFINWLTRLENDLYRVLEMRSFKAIQGGLVPMFGEKVAEHGVSSFAEKMERERQKGSLRMVSGSGVLGAVGTVVRKNTFYGD